MNNSPNNNLSSLIGEGGCLQQDQLGGNSEEVARQPAKKLLT